MERKIFIHTNRKQLFGGKISKFSFERFLPKDSGITVEFIIVNDLPAFQAFDGVTYKFNDNVERTYSFNDLQSFTLSRFMPPELMQYTGQSIVIDPDIFALTDVTELFNLGQKNGTAITACSKKGHWDSSVMVMDNSQLTHWSMQDILDRLKNKTATYTQIMQLHAEKSVTELDRQWNSLDVLNEETKILHTTGRETQPWKTGLPIDFTRNKMQKLFGIIPREPIHALLGKTKKTYQQHPDQHIEDWFIALVVDAYKADAFTEAELQKEMDANNVRHDMLDILHKHV